MKYRVLLDDPSIPLLERLLIVRQITCDVEDFFDPTFSHYRKDPFLLSDMSIAVERIIQAMKDKERIMIFGDYDVDGITSSWALYTFITQDIGYDNISIMFPHRRHDGYGLKTKHIDMMKEKSVDLIITVDNGITSVAEAAYAREIGIDLIITDHHHAGDIIPDCVAVVNPQTSPDYSFKGLCGAGVAFKLINALMTKTTRSDERRRQIFSFYLPVIAIATVADVVPLQDENRMIVKKWLEYINTGHMPPSLQGILNFLSIKWSIDTFHIGFVIGPRINAGGRVATPYDSLATLLHTGPKQHNKLQELEDLNTHRKSLQDEAIKDAKSQIDPAQNILVAYSEDYHEGIVGIVAGRITEQYNKPSLIMYVNSDTGTASGSLRAPSYFSVIDMIHHETIKPLLLRSGGHQQAGWLTIESKHIQTLIDALQTYANNIITPDTLEKEITVDTIITPEDLTVNHILDITKLAPFGEWNPEPTFLFQNAILTNTSTVGKRGKGHLKCEVTYGDHTLTAMYRSNGDLHGTLSTTVDIIGKIKKDSYTGGWILIIDHIIE